MSQLVTDKGKQWSDSGPIKKAKHIKKQASLNSTQQECEIILISKRHDKKGHIFTVFNSITQ